MMQIVTRYPSEEVGLVDGDANAARLFGAALFGGPAPWLRCGLGSAGLVPPTAWASCFLNVNLVA